MPVEQGGAGRLPQHPAAASSSRVFGIIFFFFFGPAVT